MKTLTRTLMVGLLSIPLLAGVARADASQLLQGDDAIVFAQLQRRVCVREANASCLAHRAPGSHLPIDCIARGVERCERSYRGSAFTQAWARAR
jgi:hypothetical protein